jgi:hypothetical protein
VRQSTEEGAKSKLKTILLVAAIYSKCEGGRHRKKRLAEAQEPIEIGIDECNSPIQLQKQVAPWFIFALWKRLLGDVYQQDWRRASAVAFADRQLFLADRDDAALHSHHDVSKRQQ